jgi:hypothetical protein
MLQKNNAGKLALSGLKTNVYEKSMILSAKNVKITLFFSNILKNDSINLCGQICFVHITFLFARCYISKDGVFSKCVSGMKIAFV